MSTFKFWIVLFGLLLAGAAVRAEDSWASRDYDYASRQLNDFTSRFERDLVNPISRGLRAPRTASVSRAAKAQASPTTVPARAPQMPAAMAAQYPADQRQRVMRTFEQLLAGYHQIEQKFGLAPYDVAGAMAAFAAASYMGYRNAPFPDRHFMPLVQQMQGLLGADADFRRASVRSKQDMYEQLVILGMLVASTQTALQSRPDAPLAATMQRASKNYLERMLKADADRVTLTDHGLVIR